MRYRELAQFMILLVLEVFGVSVILIFIVSVVKVFVFAEVIIGFKTANVSIKTPVEIVFKSEPLFIFHNLIL